MKDNGLLVQYFTANTPDSQDLWTKAQQDAATLKKMGATAVWFPPATKGAKGKEDMGYAPYDLYDLGEFDQKGTVATRYGTKDEYIAAIKAMKEQEIDVYADIAVRQKLGADKIEKVSAADFNSKDLPQMIGNKKVVGALSKFTFPGRKTKYSKFKWNWKHFAGIDWKQEDFKKRICELEGRNPEEAEKEFSKYDYIIGSEIDFYNQEVYDELMNWAQWYEKNTDVDGFRFQEAEAVPGWFVRDFVQYASTVPKNTGTKKNTDDSQTEYIHKDIFAVGDFWHWNSEYINNYIKSTDNTASMFDVPLHFNFHDASVANGDYNMADLLKGSIMMSNPQKAVTFVDNHESQPQGVLESYVEPWFKPLAYAVVLLRQQGYPCLYMGDYSGISAVKMKSMKTVLNKLLKLRKKYAYGEQHDYFDNKDVVGWTREGDQEHKDSGLAVVMSDGTGGTKRMYIGRQYAGMHFADVMGNAKYDIRIDDEGCGEFYVNRQGLSVWIKKDSKL
jgi:alpha-amylase